MTWENAFVPRARSRSLLLIANLLVRSRKEDKPDANLLSHGSGGKIPPRVIGHTLNGAGLLPAGDAQTTGRRPGHPLVGGVVIGQHHPDQPQDEPAQRQRGPDLLMPIIFEGADVPHEGTPFSAGPSGGSIRMASANPSQESPP